MKYDEIIPCPKSGGDLCYKIQVTPDITNYMSLSCGFWTTSLMKEDSVFYAEQLVGLAELYKDLMWEDPETKLRWLPLTINEEQKGMIFPMGSSTEDWKWAAVKAFLIPVGERQNHPIPGKPGQFLSYKTDMTSMEKFEERDFISAMEYLGLLQD